MEEGAHNTCVRAVNYKNNEGNALACVKIFARTNCTTAYDSVFDTDHGNTSNGGHASDTWENEGF